ncbi:S-adenosyl-L-methionine-dependent methyltransferase [Mrakia frigida]|uniref:class I SAM-dependent methyltransferase n=1 Tax=Mrakia frigida TaxID=29902 RepID=UPI003FCC0EDD
MSSLPESEVDRYSLAGTSTTSFTPSMSSLWYREREGIRFQVVNEAYFYPVGEEHLQIEDLWDLIRAIKYYDGPGRCFPKALEPLLNELLSKRDAQVLDVGSGLRAKWVVDMASRWPSATFVAMDLLPPVETWSPPNCIFEIADCMEGLQYQDASFELVNHSWLSWWLPDDLSYAKLVDEVARVLRPGGVLLLSEFSNEVVPEDGTSLEERYPTMAEFQVMNRAVALAAGSRYLTDVDLVFDRVLRDSGKFTDIHVSRIDAQIGERGVDPEKDQAGQYSYLMSTCGFHSWMQVLAGGAPEETQRMDGGIKAELETTRECAPGKGVKGSGVCVWARRI